MIVEMKFNARGGIDTNVSAHYLCPSLTPTHAEILIDLLGI